MKDRKPAGRYTLCSVPALFTCIVFLGCIGIKNLAAQAETPQTPSAAKEVLSEAVQGGLKGSDEFDASIGYNLKVVVRMAPVYRDSTMIGGIIEHLSKNSVVAVVSEQDSWYNVEFGAADDRRRGWMIAYGVERTHEMEYIVSIMKDPGRWQGMKVIVKAGETIMRSFPAAGAEMIKKVYRNEIFEIVGESEDFYMVRLPGAVEGWLWKGDLEIYLEPKYSKTEVHGMIQAAREHDKRIKELEALLSDLGERGRTADNEMKTLEKLHDEKLARERQLAELSSQAHYTGFDAVRKRLSLRFGILKQNFGSKMGLAGVMMKGIGFGFLINDRLAVDFSRFSGTTTLMQSTGAEQISLPSSLAGLDTLSISTGSWQVALRYSFGGIPGIPLLKTADNYIYAGLRHMSLESSAAERGSASQGLWGPVVGFGFQQRLFSRLKLDAGFRGFLSSTEVTDVRSSGSSLLTEKKVFLFNPAFFGGVSWCF